MKNIFVLFMLFRAITSAFFGGSDLTATPLIQVTPIRTWDELHGQNWSSSSLILKYRHDQYIYHNYTIDIADEDQSMRTRWLSREKRALPGKRRRGLIVGSVNYVWTFANGGQSGPTDGGGAVHIPLCYEDANAQNFVGPFLVQAIRRWHNALDQNINGCSAGVRFMILPGYCQSPQQHVHIFMNPNPQALTGESSVGANPTRNPAVPGVNHGMMMPIPRIAVIGPNGQPQPGNNPLANGYTYQDMVTHELGHVLGLEHEHLRPDGQDYGLDIDCTAIRGYQTVVNDLANNPNYWPPGTRHHPRRITIQDLCTYGELTKRLNSRRYFNMWDGRLFIPESRYNGYNAFGWQDVPTGHGLFDWNSIMLYPTRTDMVHWRLVNGVRTEIFPGGVGLPGHPSPGDIAAVKWLYPDINPGRG